MISASIALFVARTVPSADGTGRIRPIGAFGPHQSDTDFSEVDDIVGVGFLEIFPVRLRFGDS
jgi:hypothetical protein